MSVLIKDMEMPKECHGCRWFYFQGTSCTEPKYYLDARCKMVESGQDWYGKDVHGGWIGESIEHIPGWTGYYQYKHCVEMGTMASQCPLLPPAQPDPNCSEIPNNSDTISRQAAIDALRDYLAGKRCPDDGTLTCRLIENEVIEKLQPIQPEITHEQAIDYLHSTGWMQEHDRQMMLDGVHRLTAQPTIQPKRGRWIYCEDSMADCVDGYRCDQCGFFVPWDYQHKGIDFIQDYNFCPHCGSDMREVTG